MRGAGVLDGGVAGRLAQEQQHHQQREHDRAAVDREGDAVASTAGKVQGIGPMMLPSRNADPYSADVRPRGRRRQPHDQAHRRDGERHRTDAAEAAPAAGPSSRRRPRTGTSSPPPRRARDVHPALAEPRDQDAGPRHRHHPGEREPAVTIADAAAHPTSKLAAYWGRDRRDDAEAEGDHERGDDQDPDLPGDRHAGGGLLMRPRPPRWAPGAAGAQCCGAPRAPR